MTSEFEHNLDKYAELIVKVGLNVQPGQRLLIGSPAFDTLTPLEAAPLVRLIAAHAYKLGVRLVDVMWTDQQLQLVRLQHAPRDSFAEHPTWPVAGALEYAKRGDAMLLIYAHDPDLLNNLAPELVATLQQTAFKVSEPILDYVVRNAVNWCVVSVPVSGWSAKLFPGLASQAQDAALWDTIFDICRVKAVDPIAAWQGHIEQLVARSEYLNRKQYAALKLTGPGIDLTIGLPRNHVWRSGRLNSESGIPYTANIPTEEVFTMPHKDQTEGVVRATKPLSYGGALIENFSLTFANGRIVNATAEQGEEHLRTLIATDEGASRLGEVALVPHSSPISQSGLLFYNILIDENASNHIALGRAYKFSLDQGESMSDAEFAAAGGNHSLIHLDFMIGSGAMQVDGLTENGTAEPVMRNGEWAFDT